MNKSFIWPAFILLVLAQWWVPGQMIFKKEEVLGKGILYKFETAPVDPNDPFRGKYIVLNFKEAGLKFAGKGNFVERKNVYVSFFKDENGFARIASITQSKPQRSDYLETVINYISREKDSTTVFIDYPFSRYYMEEYKAPQAELIYSRAARDTIHKTYALVSILNGDAVIKDVYINDTLIHEIIQSRNIVR